MLRSGRLRLSKTQFEQHIDQVRRCHEDGFNRLLADYEMSTDDPGVHLVKGSPAATIDRLTRDLEADLVVMGTVGRTGVPGFFIGNTAEELLQTTTTSVLAVKPADFKTPVTPPRVAKSRCGRF